MIPRLSSLHLLSRVFDSPGILLEKLVLELMEDAADGLICNLPL